MKQIQFHEILYKVSSNSGDKEKNFKTILNEVSGSFKQNELSMILGPSGAGKTSLLNIISGLRPFDDGKVITNKRRSCYIRQEDLHHDFLTVEEIMKFSCKLKVPNSQRFEKKIDQVLVNLNLNTCRNVYSKDLSGGERKRLSIASELVTEADTFFIDEPTSGLDEVNANQMIRELRKLARLGNIVVCIVHQPSAKLLEMFDQLYILAKGFCVYQGKPKGICSFLKSHNIECPVDCNPTDFMIENCESDEFIVKCREKCQNGRLTFEASNEDFSFKEIDSEDLEMDQFESFPEVAFLQQFITLLQMLMLKIFRNRLAICLQLGYVSMQGLIGGALFYNSIIDSDSLFNSMKLCWIAPLSAAYNELMVPILTYPLERELIKYEYFNGWFRFWPYFCAVQFYRLPFQIFLIAIYSTILFFFTGMFTLEPWRFTYFMVVCLLVNLAAEAAGITFGALLNITKGSVIGPMVGLFYMASSFYGLDFGQVGNPIIDFFMNFIFLRNGVFASIILFFGFNREKVICKEVFCFFEDPKTFLRVVNTKTEWFGHEIVSLVLNVVAFKTFAYISIKRALNKKD